MKYLQIGMSYRFLTFWHSQKLKKTTGYRINLYSFGWNIDLGKSLVHAYAQ